jgi:alanine dehydrogenase
VYAHETPLELAASAALVVSDSPAQAAAYHERFFTPRELTHLGAVLCGDVAGRRHRDEITLYASTGLAGSEVVIASALVEAAH